VTAGEGYLLDNRQSGAGARLAALGTLFDPWTFDHARRLGLRGGWRVWEVGAGGDTVPAWFAEQVGPSGYVLATDIDTSWLDGERPFEVRGHDIGADAVPGSTFDLVHARLVLVHVHDRLRALATMVGALEPGGWLLVEDADPACQPLACIDVRGPEEVLANRLKAAFRTLLAGRGVDLAFGRKLPGLLRGAGLGDVGADAYFPVAGRACDELELTTVEQVREALRTADLATDEEIDRHVANVTSGRLDVATSPLFTAWGRKPPAGAG
jgi:SAM-dependent methyltransferase